MSERIIDQLARAVVDSHESYVREPGCRCGQCYEYRCTHCDRADGHDENCIVLLAERVLNKEV